MNLDDAYMKQDSKGMMQGGRMGRNSGKMKQPDDNMARDEVMTEDEKRKRMQEFFEQEAARMSSRPAFGNHTVTLDATRYQKKIALYDSLAQNGISWNDLRAAYDNAFQDGHDAMIDYKLAFFYASTAIAVHEHYDTTPEQCADFIHLLIDISEEYPEKPSIVAAALETTGIDTRIYDEDAIITAPGRARMASNAKASRKDELAIQRMKRSGITEDDLEYEKSVGYQAGWNSGFGYSVCYASLALALHRSYHSDKADIQAVFDRLGELKYEEISAADIIERARVEAGVDVSKLAYEDL